MSATRSCIICFWGLTLLNWARRPLPWPHPVRSALGQMSLDCQKWRHQPAAIFFPVLQGMLGQMPRQLPCRKNPTNPKTSCLWLMLEPMPKSFLEMIPVFWPVLHQPDPRLKGLRSVQVNVQHLALLSGLKSIQSPKIPAFVLLVLSCGQMRRDLRKQPKRQGSQASADQELSRQWQSCALRV